MLVKQGKNSQTKITLQFSMWKKSQNFTAQGIKQTKF